MGFSFGLILIMLISSVGHTQFHKPSVNLFKQQNKAIQNALHTECPQYASGDSTNAFNQNINHPCLKPAQPNTSP